MFEDGESLRTWALSREPFTAEELEAEQLSDHRLAYLEYEGPVLGDRGSVTRWDQGKYRLKKETPDVWQAEMHGARILGSLTLVRKTKGNHFWRVSFGALPRAD